jgi:hypothetical protein
MSKDGEKPWSDPSPQPCEKKGQERDCNDRGNRHPEEH